MIEKLTVSVDSGRLLLIDPCYLELPSTMPSGQVLGDPGCIPGLFTRGRAVVIDGFGGDGVYDVVIERSENGVARKVTAYYSIEDYLAEHGSQSECREYLTEEWPTSWPDCKTSIKDFQAFLNSAKGCYRIEEIVAKARTDDTNA